MSHARAAYRRLLAISTDCVSVVARWALSENMIIMNKPGKYSPWLVLSLSPSRSVLLPCSLALSLSPSLSLTLALSFAPSLLLPLFCSLSFAPSLLLPGSLAFSLPLSHPRAVFCSLSFAPSLLLPLFCSLALSLSPSRSRLLPLSLSLSLSLPLAVPCCSCDAVCLGNVRSEIPDLEEVAVLQGVGVVVRLPMATGLGIALCVFFQDFQASDLHGALRCIGGRCCDEYRVQKSWHHATWPLAIGVKYTTSPWYEAGGLLLLEQCLYVPK